MRIPIRTALFSEYYNGNWPPFSNEIEEGVTKAILGTLNRMEGVRLEKKHVDYHEVFGGAEITITLPHRDFFINPDKMKEKINSIFTRKKFNKVAVFFMDGRINLSFSTR